MPDLFIYTTDVFRVLVWTDSTMSEVATMSDWNIEQYQQACTEAKQWKYSTVVKAVATHNVDALDK